MKRLIHCSLFGLVLPALLACGSVDKEKKARESVLKEDLFTIRCAIEQFTEDMDRPPKSLDDLVIHDYLKEIPKDPFTSSQLTWQLVFERSDAPQDLPAHPPKDMPKPRGITDVHSGSHAIGSDGTAYADW